jgi:type III restriction enzyme
MELKKYQHDALEILKAFFQDCRIAGPKATFERMVAQEPLAKRLKGYSNQYKEINDIEHVPHVCLRLPTGGGKTLLAAHSIKVVKEAWLEKDFPVVLWLVPTNTIRLQTVEALKNTKHAYRKALDEKFEGAVRIFDIGDFETIRPQDIQQNVCIVVGTIQTLRVSTTEGRKVYKTHEDYEPHFAGVTQTQGLEREEEFKENGERNDRAGKIKLSFANLMHLHRPLMIVDEAHKAVTGLSEEVKLRVNPSAIVEFTATPRANNNTIYNVSAYELKQADMIKMPIALSEHDTWQEAVTGAILQRAQLDDVAQHDPAYIRPIVLFQAQKKGQEVTVEVLKSFLMEENGIAEKQIAIATGSQRELDGINLFDANCPIEYVITVEALKEGWDCSFAYVFCSVANISSATDVEQLLGRVLRMPYATKREDMALNKAYAHVSETKFGEAAKALRDTLVDKMGFREEEASDMIEPQTPLPLDGGMFAPKKHIPAMTFTTKALVTKALPPVLSGKVLFKTDEESGSVEIEVKGPLNAQEKAAVFELLPEEDHQGFAEEQAKYVAEIAEHLSPAQKGLSFIVPRLMAFVQEEMDFVCAEETMDYHDWYLSAYPARLEQNEFTIRETARTFEIDLDGDTLRYGSIGEDALQLSLDVDVEGWSAEGLARWLVKQCRQDDIGAPELLTWLRTLVTYLERDRNIQLSALMRCKFILARKIKDKIVEIRKKEEKTCYQRDLFGAEAKVKVSFDEGFEFQDGMFAYCPTYKGPYDFRKHFLDYVPGFDGNDEGEEFKCAQMLDSLPEVEYWVRNVDRQPGAFKLPLAHGYFYPDFVAKLRDGRLFVVEYKGAGLVTAEDARNKDTIGQKWEEVSNGKCLFLMVEKMKHGLDPRAQMLAKIEG